MTMVISGVDTELVERARSLQPLLRRHAAEGEANRRVADEVVDALTAAGMFRLFTPRRYGGFTVSLQTLLSVTEVLAEADGSSAWVVGIAAGGAFLTAHGSAEVQEEIFGPNPDARVAGNSNPLPARRVAGGVQVTGRWAYASGSPHASWAAIAVAVPGTDSDTAEEVFLGLVPRSSLILEDTWHTAGMRGTGSNTWVGTDVFVPDHRLVAMGELGEATTDYEEPTYRAPFVAVGTLTLAGTVLGLGRAALEYTIDKAGSKGMIHTVFTRQSDSVAVQVQIAHAALKITSAREAVHRIAGQVDHAAENRDVIDLAGRTWNRATVGYAVQQVLEAIQTLLNVHGAGSFAESSPLQRIWRDANVAGRHAAFNAAVGYELLGKELLGVPERISSWV